MRDVEQILEEMVAINSVFPNEHELGSYCKDLLDDFGFDVQVVELDGRPNIIAVRGNPRIGFYGHLDTVPVYGEWSTDPFHLTRKGDRLYGLGAADMKGGIAAFLSALSKGEEDALVVLCSDEENISAGAHKLVQQDVLPKVDLLISAEPLTMDDVDGTILLGRRGRVVFSVDVHAESGHAAMGTGINAIEVASSLILALNSYPCRSTDEMKQSLFVRHVEGSTESLSFPEHARFLVDMHLANGQDVESEKQRLERFLKSRYPRVDVDVLPRPTPYLMPFTTSPNIEPVKVFSRCVEQVFGTARYGYGPSVADDNVFAQALPVISFGPYGGNIHHFDEWVEVKSLHRVRDVFSTLIKSI